MISSPRFTVLALLLAGSLACDQKGPLPKALAGNREGEATRARDLRLPLKEVRGLRFGPAPAPQVEGVWFPGEAVSDELGSAILSTPVKGIVSGIPSMPGRPLPAGAVLLTIQSPELARLKADWINAKTRMGHTRSESDREQRLFAAGAGSKRDLEAATGEAATASADEEATRLALEARGLPPEKAGATFQVRAPRSGAVREYKVQLGQGVEAGQELGTFQAAQASLAKVELPLPGPGTWAAGARTEVRTSTGQIWKAHVEGTPSALTTDTKRLAYRLRLEGNRLPVPGTPVEVRVPLQKAIILPQAAIQQIGGTWGVFVKEGDTAVFRPVRRGPELGGDVMVLGGIQPGEGIAVEGAYLLKALYLKQSEPEEEGHGH